MIEQPESLIRDLVSDHGEVRAAALDSLLRSSADVSPYAVRIAACLNDPLPPHRYLALQILARIGPSAAEWIASALSRKQPEDFRSAAAAILAGMGAAAAVAVPGLCRNLPSPDAALRNAAVVALAKIGAAAVPSLRLVLPTTDPAAVAAAIDALTMIGRPAEAAVPEILSVAAAAPLPLQLGCAAAWVSLTGLPERGLPLLEAALSNQDPLIRKTAVERISMLGAIAHPAMPSLIQRTMDPNEEVRAAAVIALARMRAPLDAVMDTLLIRLGDSAADVRFAAASALAGYGTQANRALSGLRARLQDPVEKVARCAAGAIRIIEPS